MNVIVRKASVRWKGGVRGGNRVLTTGGGALTRAELLRCVSLKTNSQVDPSELIAAAYAVSFAAALSIELGLKTAAVGEIFTTTTVAMEHLAAGWTIVNLHVNVVAWLPRMTQGRFIDATLRAKTNSVIARALRPNVSMNAKLENPRGAAAPTGATKPSGASRRRGG